MSGRPDVQHDEDEDARTSSVAAVLLRRLSDAALGGLVSTLLAVCDKRPSCAAAFTLAKMSERQQLKLPREDSASATVTGTDVEWDGGQWRLLFGTPIYSATLDGHKQLNAKLAKLLAADAHGGNRPARSLVGNGWRTDDELLQRKDPSIVRLHKALMTHVQTVVNYGQARPLKFRLQLTGWAVSLGAGGSMREHVHPMAAWSGVYYITDGMGNDGALGSSGDQGGCLRLSDPRPGAMMVTMGPNDSQVQACVLSSLFSLL